MLIDLSVFYHGLDALFALEVVEALEVLESFDYLVQIPVIGAFVAVGPSPSRCKGGGLSWMGTRTCFELQA